MKLKSKTYSVSYEELADNLYLKGKIVGVEQGEQCLYITTARDSDQDVKDEDFEDFLKDANEWIDEIDIIIERI